MAIWEEDIEGIVNTLEENGIQEIIISSPFSGLLAILAEFEK